MTKRKAFFGLVALAALMGVGFAELFWQGGRGAPAERHPPAEAKGNGRATAMRIPPKPKGDDKAMAMRIPPKPKGDDKAPASL